MMSGILFVFIQGLLAFAIVGEDTDAVHCDSMLEEQGKHIQHKNQCANVALIQLFALYVNYAAAGWSLAQA